MSRPSRQPKYSRFGVASFTVSVVSAVSLSIHAAAFAMVRYGHITGDQPLAVLVRGPALVTSIVAAAAALVLGVIGLGQRQRNGLFATLGTVLSGVVVVALGILVMIFIFGAGPDR
jgi:hypothetical protein